MLRILAAVVLSSLYLFANDVPISKVETIEIEKGKWTIIEFPFKILGKDVTPFKRKILVTKLVKDKPLKSTTSVKSIAPTMIPKATIVNGKIQIKNKKTTTNKKTSKSLKVLTSENIIKLYPRNSGKTEFIVWGYDYPMVINIIVKDKIEDNDYNQHIKFIDYKIDKKVVAKFESNYHEKIIERLLTALYNKKAPKGYQKVIDNVIQKDMTNHLTFSLDISFVGNNYIGQTWNVTNTSKTIINLYEEMFAQSNVYMVSFENNILQSNETTRMFTIIKKEE